MKNSDKVHSLEENTKWLIVVIFLVPHSLSERIEGQVLPVALQAGFGVHWRSEPGA